MPSVDDGLPGYGKLEDDIKAVDRRLEMFAEESRTRDDIAQGKQDRAITMLSEIATQLADLARSDEQQWHAISDLRREQKDLKERVAALEAKPTVPRRRKPAKKRK